MIAVPALLIAVGLADPAPALEAVKTCNRNEMRNVIRAEPHRRSKFAVAAYTEQRAIAEARATLLTTPPATASAAEPTLGTALAQLDSRQRQLDDARATERSWRELFDEVRAEYLATCAGARRDED
jgi:hypothetical protein